MFGRAVLGSLVSFAIQVLISMRSLCLHVCLWYSELACVRVYVRVYSELACVRVYVRVYSDVLFWDLSFRSQFRY